MMRALPPMSVLLSLLLCATGVEAVQDPAKPVAQPETKKQDPPPPPPPPKVEVPVLPAGEDILFEKHRYEKDGFITIFYRVGHDRGRVLKAILEGAPLTVAGMSLVTATPSNEARRRILSPEGWVMESENLHLMMVSDRKEHIPFVESVLRALDVPDPQVVVEARIIEIRLDRDFQWGLEGDLSSAAAWINDSSSEGFLREVRARYQPTEALTAAPFQGSGFRFNRVSGHQGSMGGLIQMFVQNGKADVLSNPRVVVESGSQATMSAGEEIPYFETVLHPGGSTTTVKFRSTGVTLGVKPHIVGASNIHLDLSVEVSQVLAFVTGPTGSAPSFTSRKVNTKVTVHDGDEVVMGGLTRKEKTQTRRGLPILSDIPLIGWIFGRDDESNVNEEILFFIRPTILQGRKATVPLPIFDPGRK